MNPRHVHDCAQCKYMGTTMDDQGRYVDWWLHAGFRHSTSADITVIGRYGTEGDYWSCPQFLLEDPKYDTVTVLSDGKTAYSLMRIMAQHFLQRWKQGLGPSPL